jgi:hypothetical protein
VPRRYPVEFHQSACEQGGGGYAAAYVQMVRGGVGTGVTGSGSPDFNNIIVTASVGLPTSWSMRTAAEPTWTRMAFC